MLIPGAVTRIYLRRTPTDMRLGYNGLYNIVMGEFHLDPLSGDFFLFINKDKNRAKVLYFDRDGLCLWCKKLARGTFALPKRAVGDLSQGALEVNRVELAMLIDGVVAANISYKKRFFLERK